MVYSVVFNGTTLYKPGVYDRKSVELNPGSNQAATGIVGIVGEADGGAPGADEGVQTFDITEISALAAKYVSGPIVDAARALVSPGNDDDIPSGASVIRVYKTNPSTQSTAEAENQDDATPTTMFDVTSANYGATENQISFYISEGTQVDLQPVLTSDAITFPLTVTSSATMSVIVGSTTYTYTDPGDGPYADMDALLTVLNDSDNWSSAKPVIATDASSGGDSKVSLTIDTDISAFNAYNERHEYITMYIGASKGDVASEELKFRTSIALASDGTVGGTFTVSSLGNLEIGKIAPLDDNNSSPLLPLRITSISGSGPYTITVDSGLTDLSDYTTAQSAVVFDSYSHLDIDTLEVTAGPSGYVRGSRGNRVFNIAKNGETESTDENPNDIILRILYVGSGSAATMTINDVSGVKKLVTTCTGDSDSNLDIRLSDYVTISQLVEYINSYNDGAYVCVSDYYNADSASPADLDYYNAINIRTWPLEVKSAIAEITAKVNDESQFIDVERVSNVYGQLATISSDAKVFLDGAEDGGSTNSMFQDGFDALLGTRCNIVVPLVSQDASDDIADEATNEDSTYTIDSIISMVDSHCRTASSTQNRSERNSFASFKGTLAQCISKAKSINSEYTSLAIQDIRVRDATGEAYWAQPWMFAVLAAGMQAGSSIGTPLTHKYMNALGIDHEDFDPKIDYNIALKAGILYAEQPDGGGVRIDSGNTTYLKDSNQVFSQIGMFETVNYIAYNTRIQLDAAFIGKNQASGTDIGEAVYAEIVSIMSTYRRDQLLAGDDANGGLGYRDLVVTVTGGRIDFTITLTPSPEIDFILGDYIISQVQDTVS